MIDTLIIILIILVMAVGMFFIIQMLRSKSYKGDDKSLEYKDDLPILPREQRVVQDLPVSTAKTGQPTEEQDALSSLAMAISKTAVDVPKGDTDTDKSVPPNESNVHIKNEFNKSSPVLDRHMDKQKDFDQNNDPLLAAKDTVTIIITPRNHSVGLSGKEVLNIARVYGLKYGVMNMYHRYEYEDGSGGLWFSMLGVGRHGVQTFDLNTLTDQRFIGLSLFLSLPHPHALRGFDSMISTARMIAKDLNADIHDEESYIVDDAYCEQLRLQVANYQ